MVTVTAACCHIPSFLYDCHPGIMDYKTNMNIDLGNNKLQGTIGPLMKPCSKSSPDKRVII